MFGVTVRVRGLISTLTETWICSIGRNGRRRRSRAVGPDQYAWFIQDGFMTAVGLWMSSYLVVWVALGVRRALFRSER